MEFPLPSTFEYQPKPIPIKFNSIPVSFSLPSSSCSRIAHTMGKSDAEVIALFNEQVNMSADELEKWLGDPQSRDAGTGVGIESGRRIVEILRKNPTKNPDAYDEVRAPRDREQQPFVVLFFLFLPGRDDWAASKVLSSFGQEDIAHIRKVVR
jgi:hypothetical protein